MNIAFIVETALLLLVVFLIGAVLGYLVRHLFFRPASGGAEQGRAPSAPAASGVSGASGAPGGGGSADRGAERKAAGETGPYDKEEQEEKEEVREDSADPDGRPVPLPGPRGGRKDDLKRIKGVGPKIEKTLNELGIYHFDQIAGWSPKTVEWINGFISFKDRIQREKWIEQAKKLADGKETEFSKRVDKGDVPSSRK